MAEYDVAGLRNVACPWFHAGAAAEKIPLFEFFRRLASCRGSTVRQRAAGLSSGGRAE
jgi:hypothetical protein